MRPASPCYQNQNTTQTNNKEQPNIPAENTDILNKILANVVQNAIKRLYTMTKRSLYQQ